MTHGFTHMGAANGWGITSGMQAGRAIAAELGKQSLNDLVKNPLLDTAVNSCDPGGDFDHSFMSREIRPKNHLCKRYI